MSTGTKYDYSVKQLGNKNQKCSLPWRALLSVVVSDRQSTSNNIVDIKVKYKFQLTVLTIEGVRESTYLRQLHFRNIVI